MPVLRLPRNFLPTSYTATLAIDPQQPLFDGRIVITGNVSEQSEVIWLHGHYLAIKSAIAIHGGAKVRLIATRHNDDLLEFRAVTPLPAGAWTLAIVYTGAYDEGSAYGAFKQTVRGASYVYTHFEPLYARYVFPCFDEPDSKVPWKLTLDVPEKLVAVSNTPAVRERALDAGKKQVEFAVTRPLPAYLVAFGVGPFEVVDAGKTRRGTPVRILTMQGRAPEAAWAARTTASIIDLLEDFLESPYPYEKMDLLATPVRLGFGADAMENAGLITFGETWGLFDPAHATKQREYDWVVIAVHELAHQWFGDLVTMAWWDDLWLNEGFARWVEHKISARFEPAWHDERSVVSVRDVALHSERLVSARQIRQPITQPGDIRRAFDDITYNKGASVLDMFEGYLGPDVFLRGVRDYLKHHAFGTVTSADFVSAISRAAGKDVSAAFATFLEQPGAPEITATLVCAGQAPRVALNQQRYVPPGAPASPAGKPWIVPVCIAFERVGKRAETCSLLDAQTGSIALDTTRCPRWMMPNGDGRGYYRNLYTAEQVTALRDGAWPQLTPAERRAVVFDASNAAVLGKLPFPLALSFVPKLLAAGDRFSIDAALELPLGVRALIPDELRLTYEAWLRRTFGVAARKAGLTPKDAESLDVESVRHDLIDAVADVGHDPALTGEALKLADTWRDLPPAVRGEVIAIAAHASPVVFGQLLKEVHTEQDRLRRMEMLNALIRTEDPLQYRSVLPLTLDPELDPRDTRFMFFVANSEANQLAARLFVQTHLAAIEERYPRTSFVDVFTSNCSAASRDEIADYVTRKFEPRVGPLGIGAAIEVMDQCIARRKLAEPEIRRWLAGAHPADATAPHHP